MSNDSTENKGVAALKRLLTVASGRTGQCRCVAAFLLGLYDGQRFPFDLTDLCTIDNDLFEDCVRYEKLERSFVALNHLAAASIALPRPIQVLPLFGS
ncbi:MAG: hypothetical protein FWG56_10825 [Desulfovibrionaceae bacterium]|jgi:hypothetical protein|nr:hypothetical protein [Desulfovibrionaceae bacterium]